MVCTLGWSSKTNWNTHGFREMICEWLLFCASTSLSWSDRGCKQACAQEIVNYFWRVASGSCTLCDLFWTTLRVSQICHGMMTSDLAKPSQVWSWIDYYMDAKPCRIYLMCGNYHPVFVFFFNLCPPETSQKRLPGPVMTHPSRFESMFPSPQPRAERWIGISYCSLSRYLISILHRP